jgi:GT2 family glycosyltransferase
MDESAAPSFDLVVATLGRRPDELARLLASLAAQTYRGFRVVVADQGDGDRAGAGEDVPGGLELVRLRAEPGLSRARNAALALVEADLVAFPDDDCVYPPDLLERVAARFAASPGLDVLTGRTADAAGRSAPGWSREPHAVGAATVWHAGNSSSTFARTALLRRIGPFDEALGLGSGTPWSAGEDVDLLVRALAAGARVEYDPAVVVVHELRGDADLGAVGAREGAAVGYILAKHRYPRRTVARMLVRPAGGALAALARRDVGRARFHRRTLIGRIRGYRAGRRA